MASILSCPRLQSGRCIVTCISILLLVPGAVHACKITFIDVLGNRFVSRETILGAITHLRIGQDFVAKSAIADRDSIDALGLFQNVSFESRETSDGTVVLFRVVENPRVISIAIVGNEHVSTAEIMKMLSIPVGHIVDIHDLSNARNIIVNLYRKKGYAADIREVRYGEGEVTFVIVELHVNDIRVTGLRKTRFATVRRELHVRPGDLYDENKLRRGVKRLRDLEIFEDVAFVPNVDQAPPGTVDVILEIKERISTLMAFGMGASSRNEVVGYLSLNQGNWGGLAKRAQFVTEVGDRRTYEFLYTNPWLDKERTNFAFLGGDRLIFRKPHDIVASNQPSASGSFEERRRGAQFRFTRPQDERDALSFTLGFRYEDVSLVQRDTVLLNQVFSNSFGTVAAPSLGVTFDTRDSKTDPNRGWRASTGIELGTSLLGSRFSFQKLDLDIRKYVPFGQKQRDDTFRDVLAGRLMYSRAFGNVPAFEQFFVGGAETLRGYDIDQQFGDNQVIANVEYRHRLWRDLMGVAFLDWGGAWSGPLSNSRSFTPLLGKGLGLRWRSPLGLIRFDYGVGNRNRLHLSIGHAF